MKKISFPMTIGLICLMTSCAEKEEDVNDLDRMVFAEDAEEVEWDAGGADDKAPAGELSPDRQEIVIIEDPKTGEAQAPSDAL